MDLSVFCTAGFKENGILDMTSIRSLTSSKLKIIKIKQSNGLEKEFLSLDEGEGVWKEGERHYLVNKVRLVSTRGSVNSPMWVNAVSKDLYVSHEISDFIPSINN